MLTEKTTIGVSLSILVTTAIAHGRVTWTENECKIVMVYLHVFIYKYIQTDVCIERCMAAIEHFPPGQIRLDYS